MIELTLTDLFGGELNYSWVKRHTIENGENLTNRKILAIAREVFGITGKLHKKWDFYDSLCYKLDHCHIALTIDFVY